MDTWKRTHDEHAVRLAVGLTGFALKIPAENILSSRHRDHRIARARQVAMYLSHVALGMSLARIATALDRDRSTVAHACHRIEDFRDDPSIDAWLDELEEQVRSVSGLGLWYASEASTPPPIQRLQSF